MMKQDIALLAGLWHRFTGQSFLARQLAGQIKKDGGHDMSDLSEEDLVSLIEGRFAGDWNKAAFAFSELLAFYVAVDSGIQVQQVVSWVCASLIIRDAVQKGATDWELQFNNFIKVFVLVKEQLETDECVNILAHVFGSRYDSSH